MGSPSLPEPVAAYLRAKRSHDSEALVATLTEDALITDDGRRYQGADAVRAWNDEASKKVRATYEVKDVADDDGRTLVTVEVGGDFPGSPVVLRFDFTVDGDKISALTIAP
ncbi:nuclear transport factor 2 family protein [Planotetraspora kaengkrachanensis]|uniref:Polyketide cyclase n=1 Tax=Planotetraspora kaengkrachanensis TaxID=575193 RepID=A0A8J3VAG0_9ACTN|nr:nuclear transport factor 2 family protein [Planotetraspora kaengkrachanensis]GIG82784.1 polyketide cyclase [Planotetraspora kaengkrachanensis]